MVTVPYRTINGIARADEHFSESVGKLVFNDEETEYEDLFRKFFIHEKMKTSTKNLQIFSNRVVNF